MVSPAIKPNAELLNGKWNTTIKVYCDSSVSTDIKAAISTAISTWNSKLRSIGSNISIQDLTSIEASQAVTIKNYTGAVA